MGHNQPTRRVDMAFIAENRHVKPGHGARAIFLHNAIHMVIIDAFDRDLL